MPRKHLRLVRPLLFVLCVGVLSADSGTAANNRAKDPEQRMSPPGRLAAEVLERLRGARRRGEPLIPKLRERDWCRLDPDCNTALGAIGGQAELSIAVDETGQHIVVGFNDTRGFTSNPVSVSGFAFSDDGGSTFVDGGQLPGGTEDLGGGLLGPLVFGDPDVKYLGNGAFAYSSIMIGPYQDTDQLVQTLCIHYSGDYGHTWDGPYEIVSASNPNGQLTGAGEPVDAADKEFIDVDPGTGRVLVSWSSFTSLENAAGGVEISTTYSDDVVSKAGTGQAPTWSSYVVVAEGPFEGQASIPRFAGGGSNDVYLAWRQFAATSIGGAYVPLNRTGFARSTDNGQTWAPSTPSGATSGTTPTGGFFVSMDQVLGNDRVNTSPAMAVDNSGGAYDGNIYLVFARNPYPQLDGGDVVFQRSVDGGTNFSAFTILNARPAQDRAQWFPWVTVDRTTGRVYVFYYDQSVATSGDLSQVSMLFSDDGGTTWAPARPLSARPFHAGWGNDTGQPNLGDYNQAVAVNGDLIASFSVAFRPPHGFVDGLPASPSFTVPDVVVERLSPDPNPTLAQLGEVSFATAPEPGGFVEPGQSIALTIALQNYATNGLYAATMTDVAATLSTATPGVMVVQSGSTYPDLAPGVAANNDTAFELTIGAGYDASSPIELVLTVGSAGRSPVELAYSLLGNLHHPRVLLAQDFDKMDTGTVPRDWTSVHGAGQNVVPWRVDKEFCGGSRGMFHANANDAPSGKSPARWERLFSPLFTVPPDARFVTLDMDVCYDTEDDPFLPTTGYDGFFLRVTDWSAPHIGAPLILRSVLAEAFADVFTTGAVHHYPKHMPRNNAPGYFPLGDMSMWAGQSGGPQHVHMRLPGMAGRQAQLRFEFAQDSNTTCADLSTPENPRGPCGVMVDNVVVTAY